MTRLFALLALVATFASGQEATRKFRVYRSIASGTSNVVVIQQPTSGGRPLQFETGFVKGSGAFSYKLSINGQASGGSTGRPSKLDDRSPAPTATLILDPTVTGDETVIAEDFTGANERLLESAGLRLKFDAGTQKQIVLSVTSGSAISSVVYLLYSEPAAP